jgi:hypothetical protein
LTDAGLKELAPLQRLEALDLSFNLLSEEGVAELQKALPRCKIKY